jgi:hypothetical protein
MVKKTDPELVTATDASWDCNGWVQPLVPVPVPKNA